MDGIFINYRREDSAPYAGRLYDFLRRAFPNNKVFMDIDAIDPGEDFVEAINRTLTVSPVVIVVIGPNWTTIADGAGNRRLDNPDDYVVRELRAALETSARVIPVLVGGAHMPRTDTLPSNLQPLARRNALEISDTRFVTDAERLTGAISRVIRPEEPSSKQRVADIPTKSAADRTDAITTFKTLLWTSYALDVLLVFAEVAKAGEGSTIPVLLFAIVFLGFAAWFNVKLLRGKNWARMAFIALFMVTLPAAFIDFPKSVTEMALDVVSLALSIWIIRLMFSEPVKLIFLKR
jgi:hypothetical protein